MGERVFRQGTHHPLGTLKHQVLLVIVRLYRTSTSTEALHEKSCNMLAPNIIIASKIDLLNF